MDAELIQLNHLDRPPPRATLLLPPSLAVPLPGLRTLNPLRPRPLDLTPDFWPPLTSGKPSDPV